MSAFVIVDIEVLDAVPYEDYKRLAAQTIALYGGRYVVRGGRTEVLEGEWEPGRLVMLEFPSVERAIAWYESAEYATARELRRTSARMDMVVVEGLGE
jgi:uncharacterized protein (DUF1330 family)